MKYFTTVLLAVSVAMVVAIPASATLWDGGNGLIWDDALNITWTQDAGFGNLTFPEASAWESSQSGWRMANGGELSYMYLVLTGGVFSGQNKTGNQVPVDSPNVTLFNIQDIYWTGDHNDGPPPSAGIFNFSYGYGGGSIARQSSHFAVWPVHPGNLTAVPEPRAYVLVLVGLATVGYGVRWRAR